jgi:hypothetical protein
MIDELKSLGSFQKIDPDACIIIMCCLAVYVLILYG